MLFYCNFLLTILYYFLSVRDVLLSLLMKKEQEYSNLKVVQLNQYLNLKLK